MHSAQKAATILVLLILFIDQVHHGSARSRRRRICTVVHCSVTSWTSWRSCSASTCGRRGLQTRSRYIIANASCGAITCPRNLQGSRLCNYITLKGVERQPWSKWGHYKRTPCPFSGIQTRTRKKTVKDGCQGTCKYVLLLTEPCPQSQLSCFKGGKYKSNITGCVCVQGYSQVCCEKSPHLQGVYEWFP